MGVYNCSDTDNTCNFYSPLFFLIKIFNQNSNPPFHQIISRKIYALQLKGKSILVISNCSVTMAIINSENHLGCNCFLKISLAFSDALFQFADFKLLGVFGILGFCNPLLDSRLVLFLYSNGLEVEETCNANSFDLQKHLVYLGNNRQPRRRFCFKTQNFLIKKSEKLCRF